MDARGYSAKIVKANQEASIDNPGVLLGRYCISNDVSVYDVSDFFKVSRMTIYKWFTGKAIPQNRHLEKIKATLERLRYSV